MKKNDIETVMEDYLNTLPARALSDYLGRSALTVREKECLHWICHGKTSEETALIIRFALI